MSGSNAESNGRGGFTGTSLLLMFVGGAVTGAAVAYLAQSENRARVRAFARRARRKAGHLPGAMREASHAAKQAFAESYKAGGDGAGEVVATKPKKHSEAQDA